MSDVGVDGLNLKINKQEENMKLRWLARYRQCVRVTGMSWGGKHDPNTLLKILKEIMKMF